MNKRLLAYLLVVATAVLVSFVRVEQTQNAVQVQTESAQLQSIRDCIRGNLISALVRRPNANIDPLVGERLFPILDCKQSAIQQKPILLAPSEVKKYTAIVLRGRAPIVLNGKVVGSRRSVLANVKSFTDLGKK